jgi:putative spermidine/putrescine transport system permease protein
VLGIHAVFHVRVRTASTSTIGTFYALVANVIAILGGAARNATSPLRSRDREAQNLGANPWITFWRVTLPAIRPGIVAGALFGFVTSFGNLEMSLFLVGPGRTTLPIVILQYLEWKIDPTIAAVSVVQIALIGIAMLITDHYVKLARVV